MTAIFPSLISADLLNLENVIKKIDSYSNGYHLDVMDFHFVPNLTWGPDFINSIRKATKKKLLVHLMVEYPEKYLDRFKLKKSDIISVHIESPSTLMIEELLSLIKKKNLISSVALNPFTPIESILGIKTQLQHVLLMSVHPGFSGQKFLPHVLLKLKSLNTFKKTHNLHFKIAVDGGINLNNCKSIIKSGADELAIASAIFDKKSPIKALKEFSKIQKKENE